MGCPAWPYRETGTSDASRYSCGGLFVFQNKMTNTLTIIFFHVFLAMLGYAIWWPLSIIIPVIFLLKYKRSLLLMFDFVNINPTAEIIKSEKLTKCKACGKYISSIQLQKHILGGAISELEIIDTISFPHFIFTYSSHFVKYKKILSKIVKNNENIEMEDIEFNTRKAIIKGNAVHIIDFGKKEKDLSLKQHQRFSSKLLFLSFCVVVIYFYIPKNSSLFFFIYTTFGIWLISFTEEKTWY